MLTQNNYVATYVCIYLIDKTRLKIDGDNQSTGLYHSLHTDMNIIIKPLFYKQQS